MEINLSPEGMQNRIIDDILRKHDRLYCDTQGLDGKVFIALVLPYIEYVFNLYEGIKAHKNIGLVDASLHYWSAMVEQNIIDSDDNYRC